MNKSAFHDSRVGDLLSRVGEDISMLRDDVRHLVSHTARQILPAGAREIARSARGTLEAGRLHAADRMRSLREHPNQPATWVGGALVAGLLAAGVYWFCKDGCCVDNGADEEVD